MADDVVFSTVHGSRLYGFAHERSDFDTFTVDLSRSIKTRQTIDDDGNDRVRVGVWHFLDLATSGSHQSVEALFSPVKEWGPAADQYRPMLEHMHIGGADVTSKYERTIRRFAHGDFKRRRHAVRLALNLEDLRFSGRVTSVRLSPWRAAYCADLATKFKGDALARRLNVMKEHDG
jgi:hypothetical protein